MTAPDWTLVVETLALLCDESAHAHAMNNAALPRRAMQERAARFRALAQPPVAEPAAPIAPVPDSPFTEADAEDIESAFRVRAGLSVKHALRAVMDFAFTRALASGAVVSKAEAERMRDEAVSEGERRIDQSEYDRRRNARVLGLLREAVTCPVPSDSPGVSVWRAAHAADTCATATLSAAIAKADEIVAQEFPTTARPTTEET